MASTGQAFISNERALADAAVGLCHAILRGWQGLFATAPQPSPLARAARSETVRYRHPVSGRGWDGHGPQPQWLRDAVLSEGHTVEALRRAARPVSSPQ